MVEIILAMLLISYFIINYKFCKYQVLSIFLVIPLIPIIYLSLFLERYQFLVNILININIISLLLIPLFHLIIRKDNLLKNMSTRYFYIFTIIVYLYVFILIVSKEIRLNNQSSSFYPLILIVFALSTYFMTKTLKFSSFSIDIKGKLVLTLFNTILLLLISTIILIYFPLPIKINGLIISLLFLYPIIIKCYRLYKNNNPDLIINKLISINAISFLFFGIVSLFVPNSIYLFISNNYLEILKIGLYSSCVLIIPTLKKFSGNYIYNLLAILIWIITIYYLS